MSNPPRPESPSGNRASSSSSSDDVDDDDARIAAAFGGGGLLSPSEQAAAAAAQDEQKAALQRRFVELAAPELQNSVGAGAVSDDVLHGLTINAAQFKTLLRSHIAAASAGEVAVEGLENDAAMEDELEALWIELPKQQSSIGTEGVTFPSLLLALAGGGPASQHGSRRASVTSPQLPMHQLHGDFADSASSPTGMMVHRRSISGSSSTAGTGVRSPDQPHAAPAEVLRTMFQPRRGSVKLPPTSLSGMHAGGSMRGKRHSEFRPAGLGGFFSPPMPVHVPTSAGAGGSSGAGDRPRAQTLFPSEALSPSSPVPITGSLPSANHLLPQQQSQPLSSTVAPTLSAAPRSMAKSSAAAAPSSSSSPSVTFPAFSSSSSSSSASLGVSTSSLHLSNYLDLSDPDWTDLRWLVAAHPAAFTSAPPSSSSSSTSSSVGAAVADPTLSPETTLVSASAVQICMQHYLSRWLNAHELAVIASLLKFVRGATAGSKPAPGEELISFEVLARAVRCLRALIAAQQHSGAGAGQTQVIDPLPAFAQAMSLLPGAGNDDEDPTAPTLSTEELLSHLNSFAILAPSSSLGLLHSFGPGVLHAPAVQDLLLQLKSSRTERARMEKELRLLSAARENLDSSHQDLSEQVPYLQSALEAARREKLAVESEALRVPELEASLRAAKTAHDKVQKKVHELQSVTIELRADVQHHKESALQQDAAQAALNQVANKLKERNAALERELQEALAAAQAQQAQDHAASVNTHHHIPSYCFAAAAA
jgi:hypothetical protein